MQKLIFPLILAFFALQVVSCSSGYEKKESGISLNDGSEEGEENGVKDGNRFNELRTRPGTVLLTAYPDFRLVPIYKINYNKKTKKYYTGSNSYHRSYIYDDDPLNAWHDHFMPGIQALFGFNLFNISHFNFQTNESRSLFEGPVLINTLYFPSYVQDTLNGNPIKRDYYLVSVYDEDTNGDTAINKKDLRRFYHFDLDAGNRTLLIPANYSVLSSQYDLGKDIMYIKAKEDANGNGKRDEEEPVHLFWVDLKAPAKAERLY